jgi:hypothetical protein
MRFGCWIESSGRLLAGALPTQACLTWERSADSARGLPQEVLESVLVLPGDASCEGCPGKHMPTKGE